MTTFLRQLYQTMGSFSTETHIAMCNDFSTQLAKGKRKANNLAAYFAEAIEKNKVFSQLEQGFVPENRRNGDGRNPVVRAMRATPIMTVLLPTNTKYEFMFKEREIPHLRALTKKEQNAKAWIDYVARTSTRPIRPILGEIKWKGDKNPLYAFIQLLTYLSEMATPNQMKRAIQHKLFGEKMDALSTFDLHIFLANFNDRGDKGKLIGLTEKLAADFRTRLNKDHPEIASCLGDVLCISGQIEKNSDCFSNLTCCWVV